MCNQNLEIGIALKENSYNIICSPNADRKYYVDDIGVPTLLNC